MIEFRHSTASAPVPLSLAGASVGPASGTRTSTVPSRDPPEPPLVLPPLPPPIAPPIALPPLPVEPPLIPPVPDPDLPPLVELPPLATPAEAAPPVGAPPCDAVQVLTCPVRKALGRASTRAPSLPSTSTRASGTPLGPPCSHRTDGLYKLEGWAIRDCLGLQRRRRRRALSQR